MSSFDPQQHQMIAETGGMPIIAQGFPPAPPPSFIRSASFAHNHPLRSGTGDSKDSSMASSNQNGVSFASYGATDASSRRRCQRRRIPGHNPQAILISSSASVLIVAQSIVESMTSSLVQQTVAEESENNDEVVKRPVYERSNTPGQSHTLRRRCCTRRTGCWRDAATPALGSPPGTSSI